MWALARQFLVRKVDLEAEAESKEKREEGRIKKEEERRK